VFLSLKWIKIFINSIVIPKTFEFD